MYAYCCVLGQNVGEIIANELDHFCIVNASYSTKELKNKTKQQQKTATISNKPPQSLPLESALFLIIVLVLYDNGVCMYVCVCARARVCVCV